MAVFINTKFDVLEEDILKQVKVNLTQEVTIVDDAREGQEFAIYNKKVILKPNYNTVHPKYFKYCNLHVVPLEDLPNSTSSDSQYKEMIDNIFRWNP